MIKISNVDQIHITYLLYRFYRPPLLLGVITVTYTAHEFCYGCFFELSFSSHGHDADDCCVACVMQRGACVPQVSAGAVRVS